MKPEFNFRAERVVEQGRVGRKEIDEIAGWVKTEGLPELCDEQIVLFLLSCDNDVEFTRTTIRAYYRCKREAPALFDDRDLRRRDLQHQLGVLDFVVIPKRTPEGRAIVYHKLRDTRYSNYNMEPAMTIMFMLLEVVTFDDPPTGLVVIFDMKGVGLMHLTRLRMGNVKSFLQFVQEALPVQLKAVHVLNVVYFIDKILGLLKPFMKKELFDLIHFYPSTIDMEVFYRQVPRECLPEEYGGELEPVRNLHDKTVEKLQKLRPFFEAEQRQRAQ